MSDVPVCFPLRSEWEMTQPRSADPFPAPEVTSHEPAPEGWVMPSSVLLLAEYAREHGWEVVTQYARGYVPHGTTGRPGAQKESIILRFGRHPMTQRRAYADYMRTAGRGVWSWASVMLWGPGLPPYAGAGLADLKKYLRDATLSDLEVQEWVAGLKVRAAAAAVKATVKKPASRRREGMS